MRERFHLDHTKLKEEDRRFLLDSAWNEVVANERGAMHNTITTLSVLAIGISCFSLVLTTDNLMYILIYALCFFIGMYIYFRRLRQVQENLKRESGATAIDYNTLFKYHFVYARKLGD